MIYLYAAWNYSVVSAPQIPGHLSTSGSHCVRHLIIETLIIHCMLSGAWILSFPPLVTFNSRINIQCILKIFFRLLLAHPQGMYTESQALYQKMTFDAEIHHLVVRIRTFLSSHLTKLKLPASKMSKRLRCSHRLICSS